MYAPIGSNAKNAQPSADVVCVDASGPLIDDGGVLLRHPGGVAHHDADVAGERIVRADGRGDDGGCRRRRDAAHALATRRERRSTGTPASIRTAPDTGRTSRSGVTHSVSRSIVYGTPSTDWVAVMTPSGRSVNSVLRAVSISCAARLAAIERLRFWRVRFSALLMPTHDTADHHREDEDADDHLDHAEAGLVVRVPRGSALHPIDRAHHGRRLPPSVRRLDVGISGGTLEEAGSGYRESGTAAMGSPVGAPLPHFVCRTRASADLSATCRACTGIGPARGIIASCAVHAIPSRVVVPAVVLLIAAGAAAVGTGGRRTSSTGTSRTTSSTPPPTSEAGSWTRSATIPRREDRRRGHVGASAAREVDHRPARGRADRPAPDRLAPPLGGVRDRRRGAALPPGAPPLAVGLVGRLRGAPAGARRPAHRPEPDGDARHLPHDVRHGGDALPRARSRADGTPAAPEPMARIDRVVRLAVPPVGRRLPRCARSPRNGRARSRCRSRPASARSGSFTGGAAARSLDGRDRRDARGVVRRSSRSASTC